MVGFRAVLVCGVCCLTPLLLRSAGPAAAAEQHGKTAKQCNDELKANATAIEAAGESASTFFHACWWTTAAGQKTPIDTRPASATAAARDSKTAARDSKTAARDSKTAAQGSKTAEPAGPGHAREREAVAHARHVAVWHERVVTRRARRIEADAPETVETTPVEAAVPPVRVPEMHVQEVRVQQAPAPLVEEVPVTVAGVPNAVVLSVLPGFKPWVRDVLNHPAVPGLTAAP